jgi:hypothetical protein
VQWQTALIDIYCCKQQNPQSVLRSKMRVSRIVCALAWFFALSSQVIHFIGVMAMMLPNQNKQKPKTNDCNFKERRNFLSQASSLLLVPAVFPSVANGAIPVTVKDTDSIGAMARRAFRQKPPKVLRRKLDMKFAVLLMRSSYNALDTLDCVAMVSR